MGNECAANASSWQKTCSGCIGDLEIRADEPEPTMLSLDQVRGSVKNNQMIDAKLEEMMSTMQETQPMEKRVLIEWMRNRHYASVSLEQATKFEQQVVLLQSLLRGYSVRKVFEVRMPTGTFDATIDTDVLLNNFTVNETRQREGMFNFKDLDTEAIYPKEALIERPPFRLESGPVYKGQWTKDCKQRAGNGMQIWPDGSVYEGQWARNKAFGIGRLIHADGEIYEGQWANDKAHGNGRFKGLDGAVYQGQWIDDVQEGVGIEKWPDGSQYEGTYVDGEKHGQGKFTWADGSQYLGEFQENDICGYGHYSWANECSYKGNWLDNKMDGHGEYLWADGRKYKGQFLRDVKDGQGTLTWPDGRKYEGQWSQNRQHGRGKEWQADGTIKEGEWHNGKPVWSYGADGMRKSSEEHFTLHSQQSSSKRSFGTHSLLSNSIEKIDESKEYEDSAQKEIAVEQMD